MNRSHNFSAGPSTLPTQVIKELAAEFGEHLDLGMSIIEMSHRSEPYDLIHNNCIQSLKKLTQLPDEFKILLLQGGATLQFSMVPYNMDITSSPAGYVMSGTWANKAFADATNIGMAYKAWDGSEEKYSRMPTNEEIHLEPNTNYLHVTSNETINGIQFAQLPAVEAKLVVDMSSDMLTKQIPWDRIDLAYAGAQKSLGPAGLTVVFVRKSVLENSPKTLPSYLSYANHAKGNSMANTPPVFAIWATNKMLEWVKTEGGAAEMQKRALAKSSKIYETIDDSNSFYTNPVHKDNRSITNIVFRLNTEELETEFLNLAQKENLLNLKGHRSVGGIRASLYNGLDMQSVNELAEFMKTFASQMG